MEENAIHLYIMDWKWDVSKCYWIKKEIEPFCMSQMNTLY